MPSTGSLPPVEILAASATQATLFNQIVTRQKPVLFVETARVCVRAHTILTKFLGTQMFPNCQAKHDIQLIPENGPATILTSASDNDCTIARLLPIETACRLQPTSDDDVNKKPVTTIPPRVCQIEVPSDSVGTDKRRHTKYNLKDRGCSVPKGLTLIRPRCQHPGPR